ncbi:MULTISPECIES: hypothetical protein [Paenibacillus]|uniref:hypothetical protein n=1 Tax=Paenibacillus TaxID=44249 RepID=UPI0022B93A7F|nr:hypothetical protein [Paenibacillus caseinilyticus]MCZ8522479.1 hypothetical protein [Paenibacillus caseinilyticus]
MTRYYARVAPLVLLSLLLSACSLSPVPKERGEGAALGGLIEAAGAAATTEPRYVKPERLAAVQLTFGRADSLTLQQVPAPAEPMPARVYEFKQEPGLPSCSVYLYEEKSEAGQSIRAYLKTQDAWYAAGASGGDGAAAVPVRLLPRGAGAGPELVIGGAEDDSYAAMVRSLFYDEETGTWRMQEYQGHDVRRMDLDGDGQEEWVSPAVNWVPPSVGIYRWNQDSREYEYTVTENETAAALGLSEEQDEIPRYALLFQESSGWIIESGSSDRYAFFRYDGGKLVPAVLPDSRSRLMDLRRQQGHRH